MASLVGNKIVQPSQTAERQIDSTNKDVRLALGSVQQNVSLVNDHAAALTPSFMPADDGLTDLWWPMDDAAGNALANQKIVGTGKDVPLTFGLSVIPGYSSEIGGNCARIYDDPAPSNAFARKDVTANPPTYPTASLSCWFWPGVAAGVTGDRWIFGNFNSGGGTIHLNLFCTQVANLLIQFRATVNIGGSAFSCAAPGDAFVSAGAWHHIGLVANGTQIILYVDGRGISSGGASGSINWTSGTGSLWNVGASPFGGVNGAPGFIQDIRVHSTARPKEWFAEAYLRGKGRFFG